MELVRHADVESFARAARPLYEADPLRHTVALTVLETIVRTGGAPEFGVTLHAATGTAAALVCGDGRSPQVSGVPPAHAPAVVDALEPDATTGEPRLTGAMGPTPEAEAFAAAWVARTGGDVRVEGRMWLFALAELIPPTGVRGRARLADPIDDLAAMTRMEGAFTEEERGGLSSLRPPREVVERRLRVGKGELLWEIGGEVVSQASVSPHVAGMCRIGPVYTEPAHRGHGYAAGVTAAASRWALDRGARWVLLATDAANPVTNRLYPRLGYRYRYDAARLVFSRS